MKKIILILFIVMSIMGQRTIAQNIAINGIYLPQAVAIKDFHFTDNNGKSFTKENLKTHWTMMFFGFTHCGYVCPVTLKELNQLYVSLEKTLPSKDMPQIVFVTLDPERDTIARMNFYVHSFNKNFIGIRGDEEETEQFQKQLNINAVKIQQKGKPKNDYGMNHDAEILLFNPNGELQAYMAYPHKAKQLEKEYRFILTQQQ